MIMNQNSDSFIRRSARTGLKLVSKITGGRSDLELCKRSLMGKLPQGSASPKDGHKYLALSFDLDYAADTAALPALVRLLDEVGATMTVFSIGKLVDADPGPYREAVAAGHEIGNHTWSHPDNPVLNPDREFWHLTTAEMKEEITRAQDVFEQTLHVRPTGFRAPHFKDAARLLSIVEALPDFGYLSSSLASKCPVRTPFFPTRSQKHGDLSLHFPGEGEDASPLLMIPLTPCPEHRWSPFCSYHAIRAPANHSAGAGMHDLRSFSALWCQMLSLAENDGFASVYFDPMDISSPEAEDCFREMLFFAKKNGWTLTTLAEVSEHWKGTLSSRTAGLEHSD